VSLIRTPVMLVALVVVCLNLAHIPAYAVTPEQIVRELIGAPVYASDGHEVGRVADVSMGGDGEVDAVRIKTGAFLGFGEQVLTLPRGNFTVLRGAVILDLPAEAMETMRPTPNGTAQDRD
jgi:sporulation protein YlmC with PRC-barrel domain